MQFHPISPNSINELRKKLKDYRNVPIDAELDILKPMTPVHIWKESNPTKDDYAVRLARLFWLIWRHIDHIWPDFQLNDFCLIFDLDQTDNEFYYINKEVGELYKYSKTINLQADLNLFKFNEDDLYSSIFIQNHSNENFVRMKFVWHRDWTNQYHSNDQHYENDFEFFKDNTCLGQFCYVTATVIREWIANKCKEHRIHMEKRDFYYKLSSLVRRKREANKYVNYLPPTEVQRLYIELSNSLRCAILNLNNNQLYLNDALARLATIKNDYTKDWYDNNWYCNYNDGLILYLMMNIALHGTFSMNLNLKSNIEYYRLFIENLLADYEKPLNGRVYQIGSIQFLTAILCDVYEDDPNLWKHSYNGKILHTLFKHALNSSTIKPEIRDSEPIERFFNEVIIQCYHHFNIFAKYIEERQAKFLLIPTDYHSVNSPNLSYYVPAMKYLLNGNMWIKFIRNLNYSSESGTVNLHNVLIGEICLIHHHVFIIPLLHNATITNNDRLIIHTDQIEINVIVNQQENYINNRHIYFVVDSHRQNNYANILVRSTKTNNCCILV